MSINARQIALQGLRDWDDSTRFSDDILAELTRKHLLAGSNRGMVQDLFYGTIRRLESIDFVIEDLRRGKLSSQALWVLRLGIFQILHTDTAEHAAVNETVGLMPKSQRGFVNAILRNAQRGKADYLERIAKEPIEIRESHPDWLVDRWVSQHGEDATQKLCVWNNKPAPVYARLNRLAGEEALSPIREACAQNSDDEAGRCSTVEGHPDFVKIKGPIDTEWLNKGLIYIQDPSTVGACQLVGAKPGETILDACAAPGGKAAYLAGEMNNEGTLIAVDNSPRRIERLEENLDRMLVKNVEVRVADWLEGEVNPAEWPEFDAILLDVPCSNTGVMRRRIDVRWRLNPWDIPAQASSQIAICNAVFPLLKSGGRLVYSTCSIDREENEAVIDQLVEGNPDIARVSTHRTLPWSDGFDGSFAVCLEKR